MTTTTPGYYTLEDWRRVAGIRQGVIAKLEKRITRLEAENAQLRAVKG